ncbi:MAG: type I restriction enzyme HsdR N-terminal domain-containing protein [Planctomycetota bacterium]|nr:type I restriction enzyme HsdR N-terminal domain-containing protein [Planctomycetota bacterium]MDI6787383.1 type I restriction enzyme HsdR N-terminal domain-containing protein [Planctomycetota bacterium]
MPEELIEKLDAWLRQLAEYEDRIDNFGEREIQTRVTNKLLDRLGWDTSDDSVVKYEVSVTMGRETKKADYMLVSESNKCCVVETKAGNSTLDDEDARQSISYALFLKCPWAIVMNGRKLRLYDVNSFQDSNPENSLIIEIEFLSDTQRRDDILNSLQLLAKGRLDSEDGRKEILQLKSRRDLRKFIEDKRDTILDEVIPEWVKNKWGEEIDQTLLRNIVNEIFGAIQPPPQLPNPGKTQPGLQGTTAGDWTYNSKLGRGVFVYKDDSNKKINVDCPINNLLEQLRRLGLGPNTPQAIFGLYDRLRRIAELIGKRR